MKTKGYEGRINKGARVLTNDPENTQFRLGMLAFIKAPIQLSPRYVYLYGAENTSVSSVVQITAELDRPLTLTPVYFNLEKQLKYRLEEIEEGRKFEVHFESIPGPPGRYQGLLTLKTNYPEKPEITIRIRGRVVKIKG